MSRIIDKYFSILFLGIIIIVLVILKWPYLQIPYYWDEAWSYATAIFKLYEHGPSLMPGCIDPWFYRGHPLFFYFIASMWMKVFGTSLFVVHSLALLISIFTIIAVYYLGHHLYNRKVAIIAVVLLLPQSMFLAQSTLLLPEVLLALLTLLTIDLYFRGKWPWFLLFASLLLLTKETGIVLLLAIAADKLFFYKWINKEPIFCKNHLKELLFVSIPFIVFALFFILQKIKTGWFFYPEHMGMIILDKSQLINNIKKLFESFLIFDIRYMLLILIGISIIYLVYIKQAKSKDNHKIIFLSIFIVFYLLFSSINFFTIRYFISILPIYIVISAYFITKLFKEKIYLLVGCVSILFVSFSINTINKNNESDVSMYFINTVNVHKETVNFCESQAWQGKTISTGFLMSYNLSAPNLGYLNQKKNPFDNVYGDYNDNADVFIFYSNELNPKREQIKSNSSSFKLIKRFEIQKAWAEIYLKK